MASQDTDSWCFLASRGAALREAGIDALAFTLELPNGPHDGLTTDRAASVIRRLPAGVLPVIITYVNTAQEARRLIAHTGGKAIQFHGGISGAELQNLP